jgi:hypothetical protein
MANAKSGRRSMRRALLHRRAADSHGAKEVGAHRVDTSTIAVIPNPWSITYWAGT